MSLQGNLTDLPLIDLFQIFSVQNKRGALLIDYQDLKGEVYFAETGLWAALVYENTRYGRNSVSYGEEAIYAIMSWEAGDFSFELNYLPANLNRNLFVNYNYLILEQCRRRDERERQKQVIDVATLIPHLIPNPPTRAEINLSLEQWQVLLQVNGVYTVATIAGNTRQPLEELAQILEQLQNKGLVELNKISNFVPKGAPAKPNYSPNPTPQSIIYYERAVGYENLPVSNPAPVYNLPAQKWQAAPTATAIAPAPPKPVTYAKPKVQRGILSGIMAKLRGL
jgi:Domain of unknown function (DUF4388)